VELWRGIGIFTLTSPSNLTPSSSQSRSAVPSPCTPPHAPLPPLFTCNACGRKYKTKHNMLRHRSQAHPPTPLLEPHSNSSHSSPSPPWIPVEVHGNQMWDCPVPGCKRKGARGFPRKDNMTQHRRNVHGHQIAKRLRRDGNGQGGII